MYGIGRELAKRILARLQINESATLPSLSPQQMTALTAFLSSPATAQTLPRLPLAPPRFIPPVSALNLGNLNAVGSTSAAGSGLPLLSTAPKTGLLARDQAPTPPTANQRGERINAGLGDSLRDLKIESDLRRMIRENIAHHRQVGTYIGRRHAMGLPVRGQRTTSNARTAKKLNRLERRG